MIIDISNKNPAEVLAALYNAAKSQKEKDCPLSSTTEDFGKPLTIDDAETIIKNYGNDINSLYNIPLHVNLSYIRLDVAPYDAIYGEGAAKKVLLY